MKIAIIGGVAGGAGAAARLRRMSEDVEITLFERGEHISYANCGLPYYIGGAISDRDRLFVQTEEAFSDRFNIDIRIKSEVIGVDANSKTITVRNLTTGKEYTEDYDKLILSTGAEPIKPPIEGINNPKIFKLRSIPDTDQIKNYITQNKPKSAVVIGAGFIGLEMAENLHEAGLDVTIVEKANQVMAPLDYSMAVMVHQHLRSKGIKLILEEGATAFSEGNGNLNVKLEKSEPLSADMVILSIGVRPETKLAKDAGLEIGSLGGIRINEYMQTSNPDIYALGDTVEVYNPTIQQYALIPLAGPANKQARIVANNIIEGNNHKYKGTIGTSIAKVFDLTVAATGASSKLLNRFNIEHETSYTHGTSHAGYYPDALPLTIKINFSKKDGKLYGAQVVGYNGVDKRIDLFAEVIRRGGTIYDLEEIEHAYAPPYSSAKDPVNMAGFTAENIITDKVNIIHFENIDKIDKTNTILLNVSTTEEHIMGHIEGSINIPLNELRKRVNGLPTDKKIVVYCAAGLRGYIASRILIQNGFNEVFNLSGGYKLYSILNAEKNASKQDNITQPNKEHQTSLTMDTEVKKVVKIDACGLQCPGPIMQLKKNFDAINEGERLEIKVTDQAFGEDLKGWCNMVGAKLVDINNAGGIITAQVEKQAQSEACPVKQMKSNDNKTLIVFSDDLDKALAAFVIANGAAASGKKVSIFFTFWGLNVIKRTNKPKVQKDFLGKMFGMMLPSSSKKLSLSQMNMGGMGSKMMRYIMKSKNIESLEALMQQAADNGVEFIACSMSMDVMGIKKEELMDNITIGGVAAYLDRADNANTNLFI